MQRRRAGVSWIPNTVVQGWTRCAHAWITPGAIAESVRATGPTEAALYGECSDESSAPVAPAITTARAFVVFFIRTATATRSAMAP